MTLSIISIGSWWLMLLAIGIIAWPIAGSIFRENGAIGYLAAKPLGILIGAYAAWLLPSLGLTSFSRFGDFAGILCLLALAVATLRCVRLEPSWRSILLAESAFTAVLIVGIGLRSLEPDIVGLEKFMDFGFINAALRTDMMPPRDPWWGDEPINYYYFGHTWVAWLINLTGVPADHGYNLTVGLLFAIVATLGYCIVAHALRSYRGISVLAGTIAGVALVAGGNFHAVVFGIFRSWSGTTIERGYFFADATRFIGFDPLTDDKAFTEFAAYALHVADLHAHLLNLPTCLLIMLVIATFVRDQAREGLCCLPQGRVIVRPVVAAIMILLLGISIMANTWDVVIYALVAALTLTALWLQKSGTYLEGARLLGVGCLVIASALIVASPFLLIFEPFSNGVRLADKSTPLWQLLVLYGHFVPGFAICIVVLLQPRLRNPALMTGGLLLISAIVLLAIPEVAYVKDIYAGDYARANTVFKFSLQAQALAIVSLSILFGWLVRPGSRILSFVWGLLILLPLIGLISYAQYTIGPKLTFENARRASLDGFGFINDDDRELLAFVSRLELSKKEIFLETDGLSFTGEAWLSAMSGQPTALGWRVHQWLWRGDPKAVEKRSNVIRDIYRGQSAKTVCTLLSGLHIRYVVIGSSERKMHSDLNAKLLRRLGSTVFKTKTSEVVKISESCHQPR